jgi:hypothetical protein
MYNQMSTELTRVSISPVSLHRRTETTNKVYPAHFEDPSILSEMRKKGRRKKNSKWWCSGGQIHNHGSFYMYAMCIIKHNSVKRYKRIVDCVYRYSEPQSPMLWMSWWPLESLRILSMSLKSSSVNRNVNVFWLSRVCSDTPSRAPGLNTDAEDPISQFPSNNRRIDRKSHPRQNQGGIDLRTSKNAERVEMGLRTPRG